MSFRIMTNVSSLAAQRNLRQTRHLLDKSFEKLSSGHRINSASDDAAGLAISEKLRAKTRGLLQAQRNTLDGVSLIQTAEGALQEVQNILVRMRELGVQAATDTLGAPERRYLDNEVQALKSEIQRIATSTEFNGTQLLDGTAGLMEFQINTGGENLLGVDRIAFNGSNSNVCIDELDIEDLFIHDKGAAQMALGRISDALDKVSALRGDLGALQNRLYSTLNSISISVENLSAARSRMRDTDLAEESAEFAKNNILMQAGTSVLQQANTLPNLALELIR